MLVHVLALEQLANIATVDIDLTALDVTNRAEPGLRLGNVQRSERASDFFSKAHKVDWVAHSLAFTTADGEPSIAERATDLRESRELIVRYAPGGLLVGGAVDAAIGLFLSRPVHREFASTRPVARSVSDLRLLGWSHGDLRALMHKWAVLDPASAVVLLDMDHRDVAGAHHEIMCRYDLIHSEYDYISEIDHAELQTLSMGSVQTMFVRADEASFDAVIDRHKDAIVGAFRGDFSTLPISVLWSPVRRSETSASHQQRLRKLRRKERTTQLLERARGR